MTGGAKNPFVSGAVTQNAEGISVKTNGTQSGFVVLGWGSSVAEVVR